MTKTTLTATYAVTLIAGIGISLLVFRSLKSDNDSGQSAATTLKDGGKNDQSVLALGQDPLDALAAAKKP